MGYAERPPPCFRILKTIFTANRSRWRTWPPRTGTPAYVYSSQSILANYRAYDEAFGDLPHPICYAVKANSSLAVLRAAGERRSRFRYRLRRRAVSRSAGGRRSGRVVFSGVGKTADEVEYALSKRHSRLQLRIGSRAGADRRPGRAARREGGLRHPREPRCGRRHAPLHLHRAQPSTNSASPWPRRPRSTSARARYREPGGARA